VRRVNSSAETPRQNRRWGGLGSAAKAVKASTSTPQRSGSGVRETCRSREKKASGLFRVRSPFVFSWDAHGLFKAVHPVAGDEYWWILREIHYKTSEIACIIMTKDLL
jgi:hypothetical protein